MNKKVLMLAPFMGLLLTACNKGPNWKTITKEELIAIRNKIVPDITKFELPTTFKCKTEYVLNKQVTKLPMELAYDYDKMFYMQYLPSYDESGSVESYLVEYFVERNGTLYWLHYDPQGNKIVTPSTTTAREAFDETVMLEARSSLLSPIAVDPAIGMDNLLVAISLAEQAVEEAKQDPEHIKASVSYLSYSEDSFRFKDNINTTGSYKSTMKYDIIVENGLLQKYMSYLSGKQGSQSGKMVTTSTYYYNCKITIPAEADPDTWGTIVE